MKRRSFLKKLPFAASVPFTLAGIPMKVMGENALTKLIRAAENENDKVLVILQLHGGNDGMNTLIPVEQYDLYYSRRANIAIPAKNSLRKYIPLDSTLSSEKQVGLHPDMQAIKGLYDTGRAAFVQGVSYDRNNGSHFRGRDIQFMGGGADDYFDSGWVGRYLNIYYKQFGDGQLDYPADFPLEEPNDYDLTMLDPLGIEMGNDTSLIFHQSGNIPTSISLPAGKNGLENFAELVDGLPGFQEGQPDPRGYPPEVLNTSSYYKEMDWILGLEQKTDDYAARLYDVWVKGKASTITYPETYPFNAPSGSKTNYLAPQFELIARLLAGDCKTKIFMVRIGGFDTHADQTTNYDPTMGGHAALLYHISATMKAFQDDLRSRGLEDRVLTVTTSEFGRRINSNASYGTDHGTGGPILIFGKGVKPGVFGKSSPDLSDPDVRNVDLQFDYREVYANLLHNWMGATEEQVNQVFFGEYLNGELGPLATTVITGKDDEFIEKRYKLEQNYPNPAKDATTIAFRINDTLQVTIELLDSRGGKVKNIVNQVFEPGRHTIPVSLLGLQPGLYLYQMKAGVFKDVKKLMVTK